MTNGEMIQKVFNCEVCEPIIEDDIIHVIFADKQDSAIGFDWSWWNAEYKEPTTKNDLALIHTEGLDEEIRCTMCTNSMKSDKGCDGSCVVDKDMYKAVMDAIEKRIQPTTKNDIRYNRVKNELNRVENELEPTTKNDLALIHTEGLDEGIRCAMCTNSIKSDRGCDGNCVVNNAMYKKVMDVIENHIADTDKMIESTTKNDSEIREFEEIVVEYLPEELCIYPEYKGKPYFGIKYKENGEEIVGYGTYKSEVLSQYLRDYFISTTKNNLGVDKTFYEQIVEYCNEHFFVLVEKDVWEDARKALTTKNDLGVDCIDRQATLNAIIKRLGIKNETYLIATERAIYQQILAMPSVTPIRPKWHWIDIDATHSKCDRCGAIFEIASANGEANYCPNCGCAMVEPQESEED